jgi:hypothetical protein
MHGLAELFVIDLLTAKKAFSGSNTRNHNSCRTYPEQTKNELRILGRSCLLAWSGGWFGGIPQFTTIQFGRALERIRCDVHTSLNPHISCTFQFVYKACKIFATTITGHKIFHL